MTSIATTSEIYEAAREHLRGRIEQVGFFLADFEPHSQVFAVREWRPMPPEAFEHRSAYHVLLRDELRPEIISWAFRAGGCLIEVHSHGDDGSAGFSPSDIGGFEEWVPHVIWRLRGRPYAAIVTAGDSFDALAWLDGAAEPVQVERLEVDGCGYTPTAYTLSRLNDLKAIGHGN
jgi:hypothetical protein